MIAEAVLAVALIGKLPTPIPVYCTQNTSLSYALIAESEIYLDRNTCAALSGGRSYISFARAAHTLYHEWWHVAFQETDEKATECGAYAIYRDALRRYWRIARRTAQQLYMQTWGWSPYSPLPCEPTFPDLAGVA